MRGAACILCLMLATIRIAAAAEPLTYATPVVITRGGTYSGNWESNDPSVPAVLVKTAEPVVIENSNVRGRGNLIVAAVSHSRVLIRNTRGIGLNPNVAGRAAGRFYKAESFDVAIVENCYLEGTGGIYLNEWAGRKTMHHPVWIVRNRVRNIDGRKSNGQGGYLDFNSRTRLAGGRREDGFEIVQFVQLNHVRNVAGIEIAWNEVINEPEKSRVEDNINIHLSSGTQESPILIHDNYIKGAYTIKPWQADTSDADWKHDWSYSGGGILLADGSSTGSSAGCCFVRAYENQVVDTTNYGIAIASGHDCEFYNNRILSAGVLADGRPIAGQNVGGYIWDSYHDKKRGGEFFANRGRDNRIGWVKGKGRNDWWTPDAQGWTGNVNWPGEIDLKTQAGELEFWHKKLESAKILVGPTR